MSGASGAVGCVSGRAGTPRLTVYVELRFTATEQWPRAQPAPRRDAAALDCASNKRPGERVGQGLVAERLGSVRGHVWAWRQRRGRHRLGRVPPPKAHTFGALFLRTMRLSCRGRPQGR